MDALREDLKDNELDLIMHVGDISYADGLGEVWDSFMKKIEKLARSIPYMVSIGNHEYGYNTKDNAKKDPSGVSE